MTTSIMTSKRKTSLQYNFYLSYFHPIKKFHTSKYNVIFSSFVVIQLLAYLVIFISCQQHRQQQNTHKSLIAKGFNTSESELGVRTKRWLDARSLKEDNSKNSQNSPLTQSQVTLQSNRQQSWQSSQIPAANPNFEAAFQGECGKNNNSNPCGHICLDLHDGTYECSCFYGFTLAVDGYSCASAEITTIPTIKVAPSMATSPLPRIPAVSESLALGKRLSTIANKSDPSDQNKMKTSSETDAETQRRREKQTWLLEKAKRKNKLSGKKITDHLRQQSANDNRKLIDEFASGKEEGEKKKKVASSEKSSSIGDIEETVGKLGTSDEQAARVQEKRIRQRRLLMLDTAAAAPGTWVQKIRRTEGSTLSSPLALAAVKVPRMQNLPENGKASNNDITSLPRVDSQKFSYTTSVPSNSVEEQNIGGRVASSYKPQITMRYKNSLHSPTGYTLSASNKGSGAAFEQHHSAMLSGKLSSANNEQTLEGTTTTNLLAQNGLEAEVKEEQQNDHNDDDDDTANELTQNENQQSHYELINYSDLDPVDSDIRSLMTRNDKLLAELEETILLAESTSTADELKQNKQLRSVAAAAAADWPESNSAEATNDLVAREENEEQENRSNISEWDYDLSQLEELVRSTFEDYARTKTNEIADPTELALSKLEPAGERSDEEGNDNVDDEKNRDKMIVGASEIEHETNEANMSKFITEPIKKYQSFERETGKDARLSQPSGFNDGDDGDDDDGGGDVDEEEEQDQNTINDDRQEAEQRPRRLQTKQFHQQKRSGRNSIETNKKVLEGHQQSRAKLVGKKMLQMPTTLDKGDLYSMKYNDSYQACSRDKPFANRLFVAQCKDKPLSQECEWGGQCVVEFYPNLDNNQARTDDHDDNRSRKQAKLKTKARCRCPIGRGGRLCQKPVQRNVPRFLGHSYLALPMVLNSTLSRLRLLFKPEFQQISTKLFKKRQRQRPNLLLYSLKKFVLLLNDDMRRIELKYLNPSNKQLTRVIGSHDVELNKWNELIVTDDASDIDYNTQYNTHYNTINNLNQKLSDHVMENVNRIVLIIPDKILLREENSINRNLDNNNATELFVAGLPDSINTRMIKSRNDNHQHTKHGDFFVDDKSIIGFTGCIKELQINSREYNFRSDLNGDTLDGFDIDECCE